MRQVPARAHSEQTVLDIIAAALRAAATADTYQAALDATGDALLKIATLTKAGAAA